MTETAKGHAELVELIRTRLLGVGPDDQDLILEDDDWRLIIAALRPEEAAGQGEARATSEQVHRWIALAYREPEDHSRIDAPRFTRWNMEVAYRAGEMNAALTATPCPEASDAPDIVPVAWMRVLPGHVVGHIETQEDIALHQLAHGNFAPGTELKPLYSHDALAALRAELAAVQDIADALSGERDEWRDGCRAADAEVARLKDENKELVAGLEPFARVVSDDPDADSKFIWPDDPDHWDAYGQNWGKSIKVAYCRRARSLTATKGG